MANTRSVKRSLSLSMLGSVMVGALLGCSMDPKECLKLRESAFDLINTPNYCSNDSQCKAAEWPGCPKPINQTNFDKIRTSMLAFRKGKCDERPLKCDAPPAVYCQEGLCTFRYKPNPNAPPDGMRIE